MRKHLVQGRLAHIHQGLAAEVMGLDFGMMGNRHQVTSTRVIPGVIDWSVRVAIKLTIAAGAGPASTPGSSAATSCVFHAKAATDSRRIRFRAAFGDS